MACFLVSYTPLATSKHGRAAAKNYNFHRFIDGSCRCEPDFESPIVSITSLCRKSRLVPRLRIGDEVIYITLKSSFGEKCAPHNRLVAHLKVIEISGSHELAAKWYIDHEIPIPRNCMIAGSKPKPYVQTSGSSVKEWRTYSEDEKLEKWNKSYEGRANAIGTVALCEVIYLELDNPKNILPNHFEAAFGRIPGTQTPPKLPKDSSYKFLELVSAAIT